MYSIRHDPDFGILVVEIHGDYAFEDARQLLSEAIAAIRAHGCRRLLVDLHDAQLRLTTVQLYEAPGLVREAFEAAGLSVHQIRRAVVAPANLADATFLRNVATNRGYPVGLFRNVAEARAWLLESPDPPAAP